MSEKDQDFYSHKHPSFSQVIEEVKELWSMALPITLMNCLVYIRALVSVLFLGRLGSLQLAGGALSIGFTNITGYSILVGLSSALEPLCSQSHGSQNARLLSTSLRRMIVILFISIVPISFLWVNLGPILRVLGQDLEVTAMAELYCFYSLPDLITNSILQPLRVYLRSQGVSHPQMWCTLIAVVFHVPLNYWVVLVLGFGVQGVAVCSVVTNLNMGVMLVGYVYFREKKRGMSGNWGVGGWGVDGIGPLLRLAVPSCLGICLEWWWYEIVTVLSGYLDHPKVDVAATGVLIQTTSLMYTVPMALAGCVSARVGNELGAGKPYKARLAAMVALSCAFLIGIMNVIWTIIFRKNWGELFTPDKTVTGLVASVMPLMGLCELGNCPQTTGCGILRGTARPAIGARINLGSFYFVGTPVAVGLAFWFKVGFSGLWYGLLSAQVACAVWVLYAVLGCTDWEAESLKARKLTSGVELVKSGSDFNGENNEEKSFMGFSGENNVL
ncbi:hypothetical protein RND81_01G214600 [Saponaria officinalis]|uniref:Protein DETOXIFICATION n=1 Tax=Saponaria officinalis TaxID=3572 RepID=A0AAW1NGB7_SAPOF